MKVLIISLAYVPFIGGAEVAIKEITDQIPDIDFDMVTVNLDGKQPNNQTIGNVNVYRVGQGFLGKYTFPFRGFKKAKQLYREKNYDVVWAMMANQAGLVALRMKNKFPQIKYLLTLQEGDSLKRIWSRTWFMRRQYKSIYLKADRIQAISKFLGSRAKKYGYQGKVDIIPNGVAFENFAKDFSEPELNQLRAELGITPKGKVVITTSRLVYKNGLDTLISSVKDLPVKLLILGSGSLESKLQALAQELGVKDKVLFLGHKNHPAIVKYLKISDIFVRPSRSEGLGASFIEAMAAGLPVIATRVGGIPEFLIDGQTGLFCEVDNPRDLADKIQKLISDNDLKNKIVQNSRSMVSKNYNWDQIAGKMKAIFNNLNSKNYA